MTVLCRQRDQGIARIVPESSRYAERGRRILAQRQAADHRQFAAIARCAGVLPAYKTGAARAAGRREGENRRLSVADGGRTMDSHRARN
jgi:hypothetical protein